MHQIGIYYVACVVILSLLELAKHDIFEIQPIIAPFLYILGLRQQEH